MERRSPPRVSITRSGYGTRILFHGPCAHVSKPTAISHKPSGKRTWAGMSPIVAHAQSYLRVKVPRRDEEFQSHGDKLGFPRVSSFQFSLDICFLPPRRMLVLNCSALR